MKQLITIFLLLALQIPMVVAGKIDKDLLKKLTGTKWELFEEKKYGGIIPEKNKKPVQETITFSDGTILFDLVDQHYACDFTIKNNLEYWLFCTEPDQYYYKIRSLRASVLVMDMFVKNRSGKYSKKKRLTFRRQS